MDLVVSSTEASLISQLEFKLPPNSSFATERRLVSAHPSGASQFSPNGVRVMRFVLTGEDWLDPATLRLAMKVRNLDTTETLFLAAGPIRLCPQNKLMFFSVKQYLGVKIRACAAGGLVVFIKEYLPFSHLKITHYLLLILFSVWPCV